MKINCPMSGDCPLEMKKKVISRHSTLLDMCGLASFARLWERFVNLASKASKSKLALTTRKHCSISKKSHLEENYWTEAESFHFGNLANKIPKTQLLKILMVFLPTWFVMEKHIF